MFGLRNDHEVGAKDGRGVEGRAGYGDRTKKAGQERGWEETGS